MEYSRTNLTYIFQLPKIGESNFASIISQYENDLKNNLDPNKIPIEQKNIFKFDDLNQKENNPKYNNQNEEEIHGLDNTMHDNSQVIEISSSGKITMKNNINSLNTNENNNFKNEENNNILDFDDKAESISMNNNQFFINNKSFKNNKAENDFILEDIPINTINLNDDKGYLYKWRKLYFLYKEKNNMIKKNILFILEKLIDSAKNNDIINPIDIVEINSNTENRKNKSRNDIKSDEQSIKNSYTNRNSNNFRDSTDSKASYDNLTKIVTETKIKNLSSSIELKNNINNININIPNNFNNSNLFIFNDPKSQNNNKYKKTDISKIMCHKNILNGEKFKNLIDFLLYKDDLFIKNLNSDSSNVRISLESAVKNKDFGNIYTINEEDNESYDSLSLSKSIKNSAKLTPNKLDLKKNSFNNIYESLNKINSINNINKNKSNNLINRFNINNKEFQNINININKNKVIEEINIEDEEDKKNNNIDNDNNINNDKNEKNKIKDNNNINNDINNSINNKKIINIDLDMNNVNNNNDNKNDKKDNINDNNNKENDINNKDDDNYCLLNYSTPETKEKTIEKMYETINKNNNKNQELTGGSINDNFDFKFTDFNNILSKGNNELEQKNELDNHEVESKDEKNENKKEDKEKIKKD